MRGRSSRQEIKEAMEIDKVGEEDKEESQLSGAYIRSLVKQLTSTSRGNKDPCDSGEGNGFSDQSPSKSSEGSGEIETAPPQTGRAQPHKKQVRRRLHTSRPYQERLLNMAEARREIVTALKFHRAAMKQADEQKKQQQQQQQQNQQQKQLEVQQDQSPSLHVPPPIFEQEARMKSRRNPRIYPSSTDNFIHLDNFYSYYSSFSQQHHPLESQYHFPVFPSPADNLNFPLPNQPLGLNLNFHDFNIIDSNQNPSMYSTSSPSPSPSSSSSPPLSAVVEEAPSAAISYERGPYSESYGGGGLHHAMDDEEIAEIRSIGEQHQMEWSDTVNLMTSARWLKFLNTMEVEQRAKVEDDAYCQFDQVMEFPEWMNASSEGCLHQHLGDYSSDPALPW